jgi:benzoyl-CoA reductase/2-hydroxyglutaryl-CoA dehydratase subunit BcrC/BadD/HgdB
MCSSYSNIRHNVEICRAQNVDGAICFFPFSCRPYSINPLMIRQAIQEELGIPALVMEFGGYDPREYTAGQLRTRVEAFAEMVKMSKAAKVG